MAARRVIDWRIVPGDNDNYDLYLRNRRVLTDRSMSEINKHLRKHRGSGETVHSVADDGYVTNITRRIDRRQPRVLGAIPKPHRAIRTALMRL